MNFSSAISGSPKPDIRINFESTGTSMGLGPTKKFHKQLNSDYVEGTLTCLKQSVIKASVNLAFPLVLNIEPTNRCNLKCIYCPRERANKGPGDMPFELFQKIVDEASHYPKLTMLSLHKDGESFLHPRFIDMIKYAKAKDIAKTLHLNTNAICWSDAVINDIIDSGIDDITVSIDASRKETFFHHKGIDCLEKIERQVRRFFEIRKQRGATSPLVRVKIMEFEGVSNEEMVEFFQKWEPVADFVQVTGIHSWSGSIDQFQVTDEVSQKQFPCVILWYSLVVNWNGETTVCSVDWNTELKVGDANFQTLHEIWNSSTLKKIRRAHIEEKYERFPVCKNCVVWVSIGDLAEWLRERKEFYT